MPENTPKATVAQAVAVTWLAGFAIALSLFLIALSPSTVGNVLKDEIKQHRGALIRSAVVFVAVIFLIVLAFRYL